MLAIYMPITKTGTNLPTGNLVIAIRLIKNISANTGINIVLPITFNKPFL